MHVKDNTFTYRHHIKSEKTKIQVAKQQANIFKCFYDNSYPWYALYLHRSTNCWSTVDKQLAHGQVGCSLTVGHDKIILQFSSMVQYINK